MDELRPRFDVSERNDETPRPRLPSTGFSERSSSKVPYLLHSSSAWLALRGYHVWCMLVGLCLVVLMLIEVFLNEYVMLFSNPWVVGTEAESMCIAAACCTSILLLSWSSHACHTGVLLILDAARDDSFLVFRSLFRLSRINSRTALPSGSMSMLRSGHLFWKCSDLIVQLCIYGSLDILPFLVALATGRPSDWLTCVAWVSFCHMAMFWLLVCINDYVGKYYAFRRLCLEYPPNAPRGRQVLVHLGAVWARSTRTPGTSSPEDAVESSSPRCQAETSERSLGTWTGCPRCTGDVMQVLFPREGQSLSMVIPYREHWRIDLRNFMAGRRAEDYLVEDRLGRAICAAGDLEHVEEDQFPLRVFRLQDAPSPNLCLIWCDWLHRQSSRVTCLALIVLLCLAMGAIFAQQMLLIVLCAAVFFACILHLLRKHCVVARSAQRNVVIRTDEDRARLLEVLDPELCLTEAVKIGGTELPVGSQLVDDVAGGFNGMEAYLRRTPLKRAANSLVVAVRFDALDPWSVFWETFCGCSPDHIIQGCILYLLCGIVVCLVLVYTRHVGEAISGMLVLALLTLPAVGLKAFPENARCCHVAVSLVVAALALIFTCCTRTVALVGRTFVLCVCSQCLLPRKLHRLRRISLCFNVMLTLLLSTFISVSLVALVKGDLHEPHLSHRTFHFPQQGQMVFWGAENFTAAACSITYGTTDENVNLQLVDFGLFNKLVYLPEKMLQKHLKEWLPQWELVKEQRRERRCLPSDGNCDIGDWTSWFVFQGRTGTKLANTTVVTIRGTKTPLDYILDLDLWSGALMQQVFSNLLLTGPPVSAFLGSETARQWFKGKKVHYASVWEYLHHQHLWHHPEKLMYITGHSLGGGIANLLGAEFGLPSIAFSPPGVHSTAELLEIDPVRLQALALDVIPDGDPVVRTGNHGTVQLPIACADHWPRCHRIFNSVCELFDTCGDQAQPNPRELPCDFCPAKLKQRPGLAPHCSSGPAEILS